MHPIARAGVRLAIALVVVGCSGTATPGPASTPPATIAPTASATASATAAPTSVPTVPPAATPTAAPTATIAASCIDVTDAGEATTVEASARGFAWLPGEVTASVGDVITWTNRDSVAHGVATDDGSCRMASNVRGGGSRSLRFTVAGTYLFHCVVHPSMTGTIIITE